MNTAGHVLVAEDNLALQGVISLALRNAGLEVTTADTGLKAWAFLEENSVDLVLTDFNMPGMTGGSLCERMRDDPRHGATPVALLTALSADVQRDHNLDSLGVAAVIGKPFSPRDVTTQVLGLLRQKQEPPTTPAAASSDVPPNPNSD